MVQFTGIEVMSNHAPYEVEFEIDHHTGDFVLVSN